MTKATNRRGTEREPFTTIDVRAVIDATPEEQAVILAIQFLHWWLGPEESKGMPLIEAVLINPDRPPRVKAGPDAPTTKEELGQISPRSIKRAVARLRARGWLETDRKFKGPMGYTLNIPPLPFKDAYAMVGDRLPPAIRARLAPKALELWGQVGLPLGPGRPDGGASSAPGILSNQTLVPQTKEQDSPPPKAAGGKHLDQDDWWTQAKAIWQTKFPGTALGWPGVGASPPIKGFQKLLTAALSQHGLVELARRWKNCVNDAFTRPSLRVFFSDLDKWVGDAREAQKGSNNGRAFNQPHTDWTPTQREADAK